MTFKVAAGFAALTCLLFGAAQAQAQSYYFIGLTDRAALVAERDSIQWRDNRPQMTLHVIHRSPQALERSYGGDVYIQRSTLRYDFDCAQNRSRTLRMEMYPFGQSTYTPHTLSETSAWAPVISGSPLERASNMACHNQVPDGGTPTELNVIIRAYYDTLNKDENAD